jgi:hypothetical protein
MGWVSMRVYDTIPGPFIFLTLVLIPVSDIVEVVDASVIVILPREEDVVEVAGMSVGNGMA